jgi:glucose-6-phosphate-specific signal transduction histidine kinase
LGKKVFDTILAVWPRVTLLLGLKYVPGHMGLGTMRRRAERLGGQYAIRSKLGEGTTITLSVPLED